MAVYWRTERLDQLPAGVDWLSAAERAFLDTLRIEKRRRDWLLGRWTAKRAVEALLHIPEARRGAGWTGGDPPAPRFSILAAADGAPEVFVGERRLALSLSISHRDGVALCALSPLPCRLGCDLERIEPRSSAFVEDFFTPSEQAWLQAQPPSSAAWGANLIWSAKESALKLLRIGLRADTRSVQVEIGDSEPLGPTGWRPLMVGCVGGKSLRGWWRRESDLVQTLLAQPDPPPPVDLGRLAPDLGDRAPEDFDFGV